MKNDLLKGFILGVVTTACLFFMVGDIHIETDFQFGEKEVEKTNL